MFFLLINLFDWYYKGKKVKIKDLASRKGITPKGRQMARTISVLWYEMKLELTIVRRIDKHDVTTQVPTKHNCNSKN